MRNAMEIFAERLATQTDVADVRTARPGSFVLVDSRSRQAWDQGHLPGAVHLPTAEIAARAREVAEPGVAVVTYCWGPGCNGATRAALAFARLGYEVREMIGGIEYWIREGFPLVTPAGEITQPPDPLTAPAAARDERPLAQAGRDRAPAVASSERGAAMVAATGSVASAGKSEVAPGSVASAGRSDVAAGRGEVAAGRVASAARSEVAAAGSAAAIEGEEREPHLVTAFEGASGRHANGGGVDPMAVPACGC
jgi:rhodanese-related sulfurtransferase